MPTRLRITAAAIVSSLAGAAFAEAPMQLADLADLSLEQLANVTVTSASRREERLIEAPASIFVITSEDIRRAGVTRLPEALRLAPNLQVVRGDANQYIISARGGLFGTANKMLVLVDGRTLYTPLFAGVFWDAQAVMLEDVDRIEVISGPGGTLWGTNAVNGVVNIMTKNARRTQGTLVTVVGGGSQRRAEARYGGSMADGGAFRVYSLYDNRPSTELASGASAHDASERWQAGFRADWQRGDGSSTVQGDAYGANVDNLGGKRDLSGGNVRGRWVRNVNAGSDVTLQAYYDRAARMHAGSFQETLATAEVELQHALRYGRANEFVWGASYRIADDRTAATPVLGFMPGERVMRMATAYAQDERALGERLRATLGLRAEHNVYSGLEWLPNLRLTYAISPDQVLWTSLARAVRSPARIDRDLVVPGMPPYLINANESFKGEVADVAELGWRGRAGNRGTISLTAFHHRFDDLRTLGTAGSALVIQNGGKGRSSGLEGWGDFTLMPTWRLVGGFVAMSNDFEVKQGYVDLSSDKMGNNPRRTASLRSLWNVTPSHELDLGVRHVSALPNPAVPAYTVLDARAGWRASSQLDLSLLVTNLFDRRYAEFGTPAQRTSFERNILLRVTWTPW